MVLTNERTKGKRTIGNEEVRDSEDVLYLLSGRHGKNLRKREGITQRDASGVTAALVA